MIRGMEPMMSEERLRELSSLSLKKKMQRKDLTACCLQQPIGKIQKR